MANAVCAFSIKVLYRVVTVVINNLYGANTFLTHG